MYKNIQEIIINETNQSTSWILKKCVDQHLPFLTAIVNRSIDESVMPLYLKRAIITPLLKRSGLDKEEMKNYRIG